MDSTISQNIQFCDGNIVREKKHLFLNQLIFVKELLSFCQNITC